MEEIVLSNNGRFYNPEMNTEQIIQDYEEMTNFRALEVKWQEALDDLNEGIEQEEYNIEHEPDKERKEYLIAKMQYIYDKRSVAEKYQSFFCTLNNFPLLQRLYNSGIFVPSKEADKIFSDFKDYLLFQSYEYKEKAERVKKWTMILSVFGPPIWIGYGIWECLFGTTDFNPLALVGGLMFICPPIAIGLAYLVFCFVIPSIIRKAVLKGKYADDVMDQANMIAFMSAAAVAANMVSYHSYKKQHKARTNYD